MLPENVRKELESAFEHIVAAYDLLHGQDDYYDPKQPIFDFIYEFNESKDTVRGKVNVLYRALLTLSTEYKPDRADDKKWREYYD
ncbi:hypothetical protein C4A75_09510 [Brevibacillus laterosporus]|uniref:Uncharacterized protein n=1 Tax=Brevibacillus laterosporus TaxID=1465 RepID=A0AAP8QGQ8_BRELA|nr:hypothetical protein [Brevibacillus laterosporus]PPA85004.1 hypothetical protein C4A75_09510 [Brevibacillus laterosporus]PPB12896.1 hypothetical protein C4A77_00485 [Brevibacillus laterosporus]